MSDSSRRKRESGRGGQRLRKATRGSRKAAKLEIGYRLRWSDEVG